MAIERGVDDLDKADLDIQDNTKEITVDVEPRIDEMFEDFDDDDNEILEDGTMLVGMPPAPMMEQGGDFFENLAQVIDDADLGKIYSDCMSDYEDDRSSRKEWEEQYKEGLEFLGMKFEERTEPFEGASGIIHPLLAESVTQFQAQAYKEMLPSGGPVKTQVVGMMSPNTDLQAARVQEFMNYQITQVMKEYDPETDQMLFYLPLSGSAFRKVHFDQTLDRPVSRFIPSEKMIVPYGASSLDSATRITHVIDMSINDVKKLQLSGFYKKSDISYRSSPSYTADGVNEEIDELQGVKPSGDSGSDECEILEMHIDLDIPGFEDVDAEGIETGIKLPYIVTLLPKQSTILSIRRNYNQNDPLRKRIDYFVHYKFLPGVGFYGFGLTHMIGGLSRGATSILRQLIDAGTLSNLPAGFKARGIRIRDDDVPIQPGEFRDMDAPGGSLREALMPLPFKEPSATLLNLLGMLVDAGRRFASIGDMQIGDGNQEAPVGTTVALLERGSRVMSAIHKRLHYSQRIEFNLLAGLFRDYLPPQYPYMTANGDQTVKQSDFDDRIDIIPVSDPNIFSMSQRVMMAQEMLRMVQAAPEIHGPMGIYNAYKRMYEAMGIQQVDQILPPPPPPPQPQPVAAALENAGFVAMQPATPFPDQDHMAHIQIHLSFYNSAVCQTNPQIQGLVMAHIYAHIDLMARNQAQQDPEIMQMQQQMQMMQQQQMPGPPGMPGMPPQQIPGMPPQQPNPQMQQMQQQMQAVLETKVAQITAELVDQISPAFEPKQPEDPLIDLRREELDIKAADVERKAEEAEKRFGLDQERLDTQKELSEERNDIQVDIAEMKDQTAQDRLKLQQAVQMGNLAEKMTKNFFGN
tara:strand:- start:1808 stop:4387 length:2580 start_codon:yes stop_codon:yes gene_type:complete